jgi:hypothetical protein
MPAVMPTEKSALAAEVPDPRLPRNEGCAELYGYSSAVRTGPLLTGFCQM